MAADASNPSNENQTGDSGRDANWIQETERELSVKTASTAPTFGEADGTEDAERQSLLHQGTAEYQEIEEEPPAAPGDRAAPDESYNQYTEITPPAPDQSEFTSLQQVISARDLPEDDAAVTAAGSPPNQLAGGSAARGDAGRGTAAEREFGGQPAAGGGTQQAAGAEAGPGDDPEQPAPVQDGDPAAQPDTVTDPEPGTDPDGPAADEAPEDLALDNTSVAENAAGAVIGTVTATDPEGGAVSFAVDDARFEVLGDGTLKLKDGISLDYEAEASIDVTVTATDAGGNSTDQVFTLSVTDVDEAPEGVSLDSTTVAENAAGAVIGTVTATDPEGGAVSFAVDDARFEVLGDGTLKLKDAVSLDHEAEASIDVTVTATDAGGSSTDQLFTLSVTDVDEAPEGVSLDNTTVAENAAGAVIGTVTATDPEGGAVSFAVDDARFEVLGDGTLKLKDGVSLDHEAEASIDVTVTATDTGGSSTGQVFTLSVTDVDEAPEGVSLDNTTVAENAAGAVIGTVSATDPEGGAVSFAVDDARFEVLGDGTLKLKDGVSLDHEAEASIDVTVTATDAGGSSTDQVFTLSVTDMEEGAGSFSLDNNTVAENAAGAAVGTVSSDTPGGGPYSYAIDDARFEVLGDGTLKLKDGVSLDHEAEASIDVTVTATDTGGSSTGQVFTLSVTDVDEAPEGVSLDNTTVAENSAGAVIGTVSATDPEGGAVSFAVDDARFEVLGDGTLKLKDGVSLDHEAEASIDVTVTATDAGGNSTDQVFTLSVTDVDEAPEGVSLDSTTVAENAAGAVIGTVTATDPEGGAVSFAVDDARFEVLGDGTLKLKDAVSLDHEAEASIDVTVTATDAGGSSTDQLFTLSVTDVDEAPEGVSLDNTTVAENAAGAVIGTVTATDPEGGAVSFAVDDARFEVLGDGTLKLKDGISLDYEAEASIDVTVTATDAGGNSTDQVFTLSVTDVDEAPEGVSLDNTTVAENAAGAVIGTVSATDPEGGAVSFAVDDARFEVLGDGTLKLKDAVSLDHEAEASIDVTVTATDAGGSSTDQLFTLSVTDVDEAPEGVSLDNTTVAENAAGAVIGTVTATDPEGGAVSFAVDDARFEVLGDGTLKLKDGVSLDHEAEASIDVTVTATDTGGSSTGQVFTLSVTDVDEAPEGVSLDNTTVAENAAGAVIGTVSATDPEGGAVSFAVDDARFEVLGDGTLKLKDGVSLDHEAEASIDVTVTATDAGGSSTDQVFTLSVTDMEEGAGSFSLDNNTVAENAAGAAVGTVSSDTPGGGPYSYAIDDARFEVLGDGTLKLKDGVSLDHEAEASIDVTVTATDTGGSSTGQLFTLSVTDVDEAPEGVSLDNTTVAENAAGAVIGTVTATDPEGGAVSFAVDDARFEVLGDGTLKLKDGISLDHEAEASIDVTVTATDAGGNSTDQVFTLSVTDVDEAPEGVSLDGTTVAENAAGAVIGTVTATDPEGGAVSFAVDDARFEVLGDGTLKLKDGVSLDHEAEASIDVTVTATDTGGSSTGQVFTLSVTDVDEAPEGVSLDNTTVAENSAGAVIGTVSATDPEGGAVSFAVDDARFEVLGDGTLKLKDGVSLDHEAEASIDVTVTATDAGGNSTDQVFTLSVTDVDEAPEGVSLDSTTVAENAAGAVIGTVTATDPEGGAVSFAVDDARFEVLGDGTLKLKDAVSLDHEAEASIDVTVTATDTGGSSTGQVFTLSVTDVDEAPEGVSLDNTTVAENSAGAVIGTVSATDPEGGAVSFAVDDARFEVLGDGTLKLKDGVSLDHEAEASIDVTVTATDAGGNSTDQVFTLSVTDVDEAPEGVSLDSTTVAENAAGAVIGTVTATDPEGGAVSFAVDDARFEVLGDGTLKLKDAVSLDHEAEASIDVTVTATDAGGSSTDQLFTLSVTDVDEAPEGVSLDNTTVAENAAGAVIGTVTATDPEGGAVSFAVDDARFEVLGDGTLKLKDGVSLDHEAEASIDVTVTATDTGGSSTGQVFTLSVTDVDEAPEGVSLDNTTVAENAAGAVIGTVSATDPEGGAVSFAVDDARFEVLGDGTLKLKDGVSLDHEAEASIDVTVTATDAGGSSTDQVFTLSVTDVDEAPEDLALDNTSVAENAAGAVIGTVTATDPEGGAVSFAVDDARFEVLDDGTLKLKDGVSLDYEAEASIDVTVTATDAGGSSTDQLFTLSVTDVDEAPEGVSLDNTTVAENAAGAVIGTVTATDPEGGAVSIAVDDARFEVLGDGTLKLKDGVSLDHEAEASIDVTVTATDAGGSSTGQLFTLSVTDVDEAPEDLALDNTSVAENAAGAVIGTVTATDPEGGAVSFAVDDARFEVLGDGTLKLKDGVSLDHEAEASIDVTVTATDAGGSSTDQVFTLSVTDMEEGAGSFSLDNNTVAENAAGAAVGTVSSDTPGGGPYSYAIDDARFEVLGDGTLKLKDGVSLDHEAEASIDVTVTATDAGGSSTDQLFTLSVTDVDEAPEDLALDNTSVTENAAGAVIGTVTATDPEGGAVSFAVDDARFEVLGDGTLKLKDGVSLDYEAEASIDVTVTATDAGGSSTDQVFTLSVTDVDEAPEGVSLDNTTVVENAASAVIGTVTATDPEGGAVSFAVDDARFEVLDDGTLKLKDGISLDHEAEASIDVTVTATDAGGSSTDQLFTLSVTDVDEAPEDLALDNTSVTENAAGAVIGTVTANDPEGGAVSFAVDDARFEVLGDGTLKLKDGVSLDHEAEASIDVTVTATDAGENSTGQLFTLSVTDVPVTPAAVSVHTSFHVEQIAVVDGVLNILDIDYNSEPLDELYTQTIDFPSTPFTFFDLVTPDVFATKVTGRINVEETGTYEFRMTTGDTAIVWIDGATTIVKAVEGLVTVELASCALTAGEHEIVIHHLDLNGDAEMTLEWRGPGETEFSLVTPSPLGSIENNDDAGFIVGIDTGTSTLEAVKLTNVPDNWVLSSEGDTAVASGGEVDVTGWDLSQLVIAPASDDLGTVTLELETTLRSAEGEVETGSTSFDVDVVPNDGILLDLDIDLGGIGVGVDLGLDASTPEADLEVDLMLAPEAMTAPVEAPPLTPLDEAAAPALF